MKKILWISPIAPYDSIPNAGGKDENYYIKSIAKDNDVTLISFCRFDEINKINYEGYNIKPYIYEYKLDLKSRVVRNIKFDLLTKVNPFDKYCNFVSGVLKDFILKTIIQLKKNDYYPDVIILDWTQCILLIEDIKKIYDNSKYIGIEVDVSFLGIYRKLCLEQENTYKRRKYNKFKKIELNALRQLDLIICNNNKDNRLLIDNGICNQSIKTINVFSTSHKDFLRKNIKKNTVFFFGAMERPENYKSAIWFINNVMKDLQDIDFLIIGGNPVDELKKYESENVHILGYVKDIREYFESSLCMVAPLVAGAGIKVKVLEAMSAGVPVLTNEIGIEGIYARKNIEYIYCKNPNDYINSIHMLQQNEKALRDISINCRKFYYNKYDNIKSAENFNKILNSI